METEIQKFISEFIGNYGWLFITGFLMIFFKEAIASIYYGLKFIIGNEYNIDDIVYFNNKKCRIVRQNIFKTTFYILDDDKKFHINNNKLQEFIIEKDLTKGN